MSRYDSGNEYSNSEQTRLSASSPNFRPRRLKILNDVPRRARRKSDDDDDDDDDAGEAGELNHVESPKDGPV